jgi:diguanylate cyclase (GGDEF)-like protein
MDNTVVIVRTQGLEDLRAVFKRLSNLGYSLHMTSHKELIADLRTLMSQKATDREWAFVLVLTKRVYFREEKQKELATFLLGSEFKAEPVFLVVGRDFTWKEIKHISQRNNLFFLLTPDKEQLLEDRYLNGFRGLIEKGLLDYRHGRQLVGLIQNDFLGFVEKEELRASKEEVEQLNMELETKNKIDDLTQLLNRKGIIEYMQRAKGRATRERWRLNSQGNPTEMGGGTLEEYFGHLSCMMIDIDDFKKVNDTYGHIVGDKVLRALGVLFNDERIFRTDDVCGRYGGEEFIVILPATGSGNAVNPAEKLREAFKDFVFKSEEGEPFTVTLSVGVAELEDSEESIEELINKADIALYEAKETGKDRTVVYKKEKHSMRASAPPGEEADADARS